MLIDDGKMVVVVREKGADFVWCEVMNDATISSRKGFNLPDTTVASSPLTPKDRADLEFIVQVGPGRGGRKSHRGRARERARVAAAPESGEPGRASGGAGRRR